MPDQNQTPDARAMRAEAERASKLVDSLPRGMQRAASEPPPLSDSGERETLPDHLDFGDDELSAAWREVHRVTGAPEVRPSELRSFLAHLKLAAAPSSPTAGGEAGEPVDPEVRDEYRCIQCGAFEFQGGCEHDVEMHYVEFSDWAEERKLRGLPAGGEGDEEASRGEPREFTIQYEQIGATWHLTAHVARGRVPAYDESFYAREVVKPCEGERAGGNQADDGSTEGRGQEQHGGWRAPTVPAEPNETSASAPTAPADPRAGGEGDDERLFAEFAEAFRAGDWPRVRTLSRRAEEMRTPAPPVSSVEEGRAWTDRSGASSRQRLPGPDGEWVIAVAPHSGAPTFTFDLEAPKVTAIAEGGPWLVTQNMTRDQLAEHVGNCEAALAREGRDAPAREGLELWVTTPAGKGNWRVREPYAARVDAAAGWDVKLMREVVVPACEDGGDDGDR